MMPIIKKCAMGKEQGLVLNIDQREGVIVQSLLRLTILFYLFVLIASKGILSN